MNEADIQRAADALRAAGWTAWRPARCPATVVPTDPPLMAADGATEVRCTERPDHDGAHHGTTLIRLVTW